MGISPRTVDDHRVQQAQRVLALNRSDDGAREDGVFAEVNGFRLEDGVNDPDYGIFGFLRFPHKSIIGMVVNKSLKLQVCVVIQRGGQPVVPRCVSGMKSVVGRGGSGVRFESG